MCSNTKNCLDTDLVLCYNMNNNMRNIGVVGSGERKLSTILLTAMIMGELPNNAIALIDDVNGDVKTTKLPKLGEPINLDLSSEDLAKIAKAKSKREVKLKRKAEQRISSKV